MHEPDCNSDLAGHVHVLRNRLDELQLRLDQPTLPPAFRPNPATHIPAPHVKFATFSGAPHEDYHSWQKSVKNQLTFVQCLVCPSPRTPWISISNPPLGMPLPHLNYP